MCVCLQRSTWGQNRRRAYLPRINIKGQKIVSPEAGWEKREERKQTPAPDAHWTETKAKDEESRSGHTWCCISHNNTQMIQKYYRLIQASCSQCVTCMTSSSSHTPETLNIQWPHNNNNTCLNPWGCLLSTPPPTHILDGMQLIYCFYITKVFWWKQFCIFGSQVGGFLMYMIWI